jgi:DNA polymerase-3 subunit delta'
LRRHCCRRAADPANAAQRVDHSIRICPKCAQPAGRLRVDASRRSNAASHTPFESSGAYSSSHADVNDFAANRLLKTLEEPPSFAHSSTFTDRLDGVMPTIVSRCMARALCAAGGQVADARARAEAS